VVIARQGGVVDRLWPVAALGAGFVMLGAAAASGHLFGDANARATAPEPVRPGDLHTLPPLSLRPVPHGQAGGAQANLHWLAVAGLALLLALGALLVLLLARRAWQKVRSRPAARTGPPGEHADVVQLREDLLTEARLSSERLLGGGDVREAVIAAYVAFEAAVARAGVARPAHETSAELLARVLRSLAVPADAARRLVTLYERVRFGESGADASMRDEALACLDAVDGALAGALR
jgi:hypothetical protein